MDIFKVLIADDEPMIREGLSQIVKDLDLPLTIVGEAKNGLEALKLSQVLEPDIILTDICMPKLSGFEFIRQLKESIKDIKIIIISGFNEFEYAREAIQLGVCAYLLKPINEGELVETLKECMGIDMAADNIEEREYPSLVDHCLGVLKEVYAEGSCDLKSVAKNLAVNPDYLSRKLKSETGLSFKEWLTKLRIQKSLELLGTKKHSIYEIAEMVGYSNQHYFSTAFKNYTGYSPKQYQEMEYGKK